MTQVDKHTSQIIAETLIDLESRFSEKFDPIVGELTAIRMEMHEMSTSMHTTPCEHFVLHQKEHDRWRTERSQRKEDIRKFKLNIAAIVLAAGAIGVVGALLFAFGHGYFNG